MSPKIDALRHATKAEAAYEAVKRLILAGVLPPGEPINQAQLAVELGVSITPVREAMRSLDKEGWVVSIGHGDLAVRGIEPGEMAEVYQAKALLELEATRRAATNRTEQDIERMRSAVISARGSHPTEVEAFRATRAVHEAVYRASHHHVIIELLDTLWDQYERHQMVLKELLESSMVQDEHERIVDAVIRGDVDGAVELLRHHLDRASSKVHNTTDSQAVGVDGSSGLRTASNGQVGQSSDRP